MTAPVVRARRLVDAPIVHPRLDESIGENIQGPSLIRVPDWVEAPLGRYYLYFADHKGAWIRLAFADALEGPWRIHTPGSLQLDDSLFLTQAPDWTEAQAQEIRARLSALGVRFPHDPILDMTVPHIASPDVHVDHDARRIRMYYHGLERFAEQVTRVSTSRDGLAFEAREEVLGPSYFRTVEIDGWTVAMAMPGRFFRSRDPLSGFEEGPRLFGPTQRHAALLLRGDLLHVFHTNVGDAPERILVSTIDTRAPFEEWQASEAVEVLRPERSWEGAELPVVPSLRSVAPNPVNQLRDPAVFEEAGRAFLLYAVAGEAGIGLAELEFGD
ncbi:MAG: hypothetical protein V2J24_12915 [Pseudomonadales bacterium]|jgi:hypothetical protein|nr:hypothetical protein [Pseudomonadales bacterium]